MDILWPVGQAAKTAPSHGAIGSSILPRVTIQKDCSNRCGLFLFASTFPLFLHRHRLPFRFSMDQLLDTAFFQRFMRSTSEPPIRTEQDPPGKIPLHTGVFLPCVFILPYTVPYLLLASLFL